MTTLVAKYLTKLRAAPDRQLPECGRTVPGQGYEILLRKLVDGEFWSYVRIPKGAAVGWVRDCVNEVETWKERRDDGE